MHFFIVANMYFAGSLLVIHIHIISFLSSTKFLDSSVNLFTFFFLQLEGYRKVIFNTIFYVLSVITCQTLSVDLWE